MKYIFLFTWALLTACSHQKIDSTAVLATKKEGYIQNNSLSHPLFLTTNILEKEVPKNAVLIHLGHFLNSQKSKEENELILRSLATQKFHLINLTLEDLLIAEAKNISLENFKELIFLNSTISDIAQGKLYSKENIVSSYTLDDLVFVGLSDMNLDKNLLVEGYIVNDYVASILKIKKSTKDFKDKKFVIIHNLKDNIAPIMDRLPPSFINSLTE